MTLRVAERLADTETPIAVALLYRPETEPEWIRSEMHRVSGDSWRGEFPVDRIGCYRYTVEGWIESFKTWRGDLLRRIHAQRDTDID